MKFLFEIGLEELPSRYVDKASKELLENFKVELKKARIEYSNEKYFNSPRRIALSIEMADNQKDLYEKKIGPSKTVFYNNNEISKAGLGFLKANNVNEENVKFEETEKGTYIYIEKEQKGDKTINVLSTLLDSAIRNIEFDKTMKWSNKSFRFARPIKWILALVDNKVLDFEFEGIKASNITRGMRVFGNQNLIIDDMENYEEKLLQEYVIVNPNLRRQKILESITKNCEIGGDKAIINDYLLDEVVNLVEYPYAIKGEFNKNYLELPEDIITITMETHQRYFPVKDSNGTLTNKFIVIRNAPEYSEIVKKGNEKVIEPRLADAKFFFDEDLKIRLDDNVLKLKNVLFQKDMGTIYEKMLRSQKIAKYLIDTLKLENKEDILRTIYLSKADLVSNVISEKEFTKLQGFMGSVYAQKFGEKENVYKGIFEHYLPRNNGDILPETTEGSIASIVDKMDTVVGAFSVNLIPTSSKDPYALRRSATGIVQVILNSKLDIDYMELISESMQIFENDKKVLNENAKNNIIEFFKQRIEAVLSADYSKQLINYLLNTETKLVTLKNNLDKLKVLAESENFDVLINLIKRLKNISKDTTNTMLNLEKLNTKEEKELYNLSKNLEGKFSDIEILLENKEVINNFFDNVIINAEDEIIKQNRLALINNIVLKIEKIIQV